ncbi:hypothetical protein Q5H92_08900 [Hymenobacter sp. M29]|uniref:Uncharacterized protein n=1 Tax=Hymenobacter mellowenesis TaxID=3063995 RepID=A0ABT9A9G5_9BACT|nr:hypothetical protein [Hymenobacter sp. M29]MDO7846473.1 hypothetical protein [Hymenobacter sp. M29]
MVRIKIKDSEGAELFGTLPTSWGSTPLAPFLALATAKTMPERCVAVAQMLGVPEEVFLSDVSHLVPIQRAAPWLFDGTLPDATELVPTIYHEGKRYNHVGHLDRINGEQMEALLNFLRDHEANPLASSPALLAVLYCPAKTKQTADVVAAAARAFETLDMAQAWPALAVFLRSSGRAAWSIRTALALEKELRTILETLEAAMPPTTASTTLWQRARGGLVRLWLRNAKKTLSKF